VSNSKLVYSTAAGRICPTCGWPIDNCQCSKTLKEGKERVPDRVVAKMRMEKKGRGGKTVTVIYALPNNAEFLKNLCSDLKKACGCGGATTDDGVELQGDLRERVRTHLEKKGFIVKG
jgi:translation initiation factor 1